MTNLQEGTTAPDFTLPDQDGNPVTLSALRGRKVVLYFYPKDDTPGCTKEACGIRDQHEQIVAQDAVVLGVSPDDPASHARFRQKYGLPFTLLSDTEHRVADTYGVWVQKKMYGREYMGVDRTTFLVSEDGTIERIFRKVDPAAHPEELLEALAGAAAG